MGMNSTDAKSLETKFLSRTHLCDELNDTTGLLDLALGVLADVSGTNDQRDLRNPALAENFAVAEGEEVEDRCGILGLTSEVLLALLEGNEGPKLRGVVRALARDGHCTDTAYLVEVDDRLPVVVLELVEVSHTNLSEVTRMVFVQIGSVVVLTTGHTTTTGMLAVLSDTTVTGRDVTTAVNEVLDYVPYTDSDFRMRCSRNAEALRRGKCGLNTQKDRHTACESW
jgi:hypothetical protein